MWSIRSASSSRQDGRYIAALIALGRLAGQDVVDADHLERRGERGWKGIDGVPTDWQASAMIRACRAKGRDHELARSGDGSLCRRTVRLALVVFDKEVEHRAVMPQIPIARGHAPCDVGVDPLDLVGARPQAGTGAFERFAADVQHRDVAIAAIEQFVDESAVARTDVDHRVRRRGVSSDQLECCRRGLARIFHRAAWGDAGVVTESGAKALRTRSTAASSAFVQGQCWSRRSRRPVGVMRAATWSSR